MNMKIRIGTLALVFVAGAFAGCAGKDEIATVDVEKQAFEDLRNEIREVIDDPDREAAAITLVDALSEDLAALQERISARKKTVRELHADYDSTRADFEAFIEQVGGQIQSNKRQVSERQRELFAIITSDERSEITKAHTKAMDAAIRSIQAI